MIAQIILFVVIIMMVYHSEDLIEISYQLIAGYNERKRREQLHRHKIEKALQEERKKLLSSSFEE